MLSTDKAVEPLNLYGMTKAVAEKIWLNACFCKPIFAVARYGNIMGSRGSVLDLYRHIDTDKLPLTSPGMSRFWLDYSEAIEIVMRALRELPQVIYVPKARTFLMKTLIEAFNRELEYVGARPGEKTAEILISKYEALHTIICENHYEILPQLPYDDEIDFTERWWKPKYLNLPLISSNNNMTVEEIRRLI